MYDETFNESSFVYDDEGNVVEELAVEDVGENEDDSTFYDNEGDVVGGDELSADDESAEDTDSVSEQTESVNEQAESDTIKPSDDVSGLIKPDFIPGSKEFFSAVEASAIERFNKETGEEFDEFDPKHLIKLNYFARLEAEDREQEYRDAVAFIRRSETAKNLEESLHWKLNEILTTPDLKVRLSQELGKISVAKYAALEKKIESGDFSEILDMATRVAGGTVRSKTTATKKAGRANGVSLFSDLLI